MSLGHHQPADQASGGVLLLPVMCSETRTWQLINKFRRRQHGARHTRNARSAAAAATADDGWCWWLFNTQMCGPNGLHDLRLSVRFEDCFHPLDHLTVWLLKIVALLCCAEQSYSCNPLVILVHVSVDITHRWTAMCWPPEYDIRHTIHRLHSKTGKGKGKGRILAIALLTWVTLVTRSALQSRKWQLIGTS